MSFRNNFSDENHPPKSKQCSLSKCHRLVCFLVGLLIVYCFTKCVLSLLIAYDDIQKFEYSNSFFYYLVKNRFIEYMGILMTVALEFCLYISQYRNAAHKQASRSSIIYFFLFL